MIPAVGYLAKSYRSRKVAAANFCTSAHEKENP
jgi:hypothetical protein